MVQKNISIGILVYPCCLGSEVFGFRDTIAIANAVAANSTRPGLSTTLFRARRQKVHLSGGEVLECPQMTAPDFDVLLIPAFMFVNLKDFKAQLPHLGPEVELISQVAKEGREITSICGGAFLLGEAGLLDGVRCTTSWLVTPLLEKTAPKALLETNAVLVSDRNITTTGAYSAAFDLAIHIIEKYMGPVIAQKTQSIGLLDGVRQTQTPYYDKALLQARRSPFVAKIESWMIDNMDRPHSLEALAEYAGVTPRTLHRRYKKERGITPLEFLQSERIEKAKHLLRSSDWTLAQISVEVGYEDISAFRRLFQRHAQTTPGAYRRKFSG